MKIYAQEHKKLAFLGENQELQRKRSDILTKVIV